mmetsp:Transcript_32560/g.79702  ORF Transcript_32560/g.79702 Transcript_32560/m.79702 type:complete len:210 (+) Transcript_32560:706-1335(+)
MRHHHFLSSKRNATPLLAELPPAVSAVVSPSAAPTAAAARSSSSGGGGGGGGQRVGLDVGWEWVGVRGEVLRGDGWVALDGLEFVGWVGGGGWRRFGGEGGEVFAGLAVDAFVGAEGGLPHEGFVAVGVRAGEWLFAGVEAEVGFEVVVFGKFLFAADKGAAVLADTARGNRNGRTHPRDLHHTDPVPNPQPARARPSPTGAQICVPRK